MDMGHSLAISLLYFFMEFHGRENHSNKVQVYRYPSLFNSSIFNMMLLRSL